MTNLVPVPVGAPESGRVLLIDDDPHICLAFRRLLELRGHTVFQAADGREGLAAAERDSPEIILLDLNMPVMGGMEVLRRFAKECPDVPVIIVSSSDEIRDAIEALKLGARDYLVKPLLETSVLTRAVETNLERARLLRANKQIRLELELYSEQIREDEESGRKVQARLFPAHDWQFGDYRFQHQVIPSMFLSGDFVDYFGINDQFAGFYCADVSGHGVSSALVTVLVKSFVNKYHERHADRQDPLILEPEHVLEKLNQELLHEQLGKHLTMFYGVLDLKANTLRFASGGHYPPALLFRPEGVRALEPNGMAVGLFPLAVFQSETVALPEAFRLLVFTDGALETLALPTGEARLAHLQTLTTRDALRRFVAAAGDQQHLPDDFTVLSVTRGDMP